MQKFMSFLYPAGVAAFLQPFFLNNSGRDGVWYVALPLSQVVREKIFRSIVERLSPRSLSR